MERGAALRNMNTGVVIVMEETYDQSRRKIVVPIWEKSNLTLEEAAAYSNIGVNKLREITNCENCDFVLWVGNKRLVKRRLFDRYLERAFSI